MRPQMAPAPRATLCRARVPLQAALPAAPLLILWPQSLSPSDLAWPPWSLMRVSTRGSLRDEPVYWTPLGHFIVNREDNCMTGICPPSTIQEVVLWSAGTLSLEERVSALLQGISEPRRATQRLARCSQWSPEGCFTATTRLEVEAWGPPSWKPAFCWQALL